MKGNVTLSGRGVYMPRSHEWRECVYRTINIHSACSIQDPPREVAMDGSSCGKELHSRDDESSFQTFSCLHVKLNFILSGFFPVQLVFEKYT